MLFLACAPSYTRAQAPAAAPAPAAQAVPAVEVHVGSASELLKAMRTPTPEAKKAVDAVVAKADPAMVAELLRLPGSPTKRENAQRVVVRMGRKTVPTLFTLFDDEAAAVPAGSVLARVLTVKDSDMIPQLVACAETKPLVSNYCATTVVQVSGPLAAAQVPVLAKCLKSEQASLRPYCAAALGRVGHKAAAAREALRAALQDPSPEVRRQAKGALRRIGA